MDVAVEVAHHVVPATLKARETRMALSQVAKEDHRGPRVATDQGEDAEDSEVDIWEGTWVPLEVCVSIISSCLTS